MQFEITLRDSCDLAALRIAGIDPDNYFEIWNKAFVKRARLPISTTCSYFLGNTPADVHLNLLEMDDAARIQFEVADKSIARRIQDKLFYYSTENTRRIPYKPAEKVRPITQKILKRDGLTMDDIQNRKGRMPARCVEALMRHYDETESALTHDICWLFKKDVMSKTDQIRVARWLVKHLATEKDPTTRNDIAAQLYNELAVSEIADDLIALLKDSNCKGRDGFLFDVFAKTKDPRILDVAVSLLGDEEMTEAALAYIGKRKAKQHVERVRKFLDHGNPGIRREAKRTMKQLGFPVELPPPPVHLVKKRSSMSKTLVEWSANLDGDELTPVLQKLAKKVEKGFGQREIAEIEGVVEEMKVEQTRAFQFPITVAGKKTELWLVIFMDDTDSPDLGIFSSPELIKKLDKLLPDCK